MCYRYLFIFICTQTIVFSSLEEGEEGKKGVLLKFWLIPGSVHHFFYVQAQVEKETMRSDGTNQCYLAGVHDSSCLSGKHSGEPDRTCPQVSTQHPNDLWLCTEASPLLGTEVTTQHPDDLRPCTEASLGSPIAGYTKHPNCVLLKTVLPSMSLH